MHSQSPPNVFTRPDTLFGVCQALGEDFGVSPLILRLAFALPLFWNPYVAVGAYLALGVIVLLSRRLVPNPTAAPAPAESFEQETVQAAAPEPEFALAA